jgi:hypothetical protein
MKEPATKKEEIKKEDESSQPAPSLKKVKIRLRYNRWLVKNIPFYFFAAALAIFYIANGHYADKMVREISVKEKNLKELEFKYKIVKRDVIFRSKQSELAKAVAPLGLQELTEPPYVIKDTLK